MKYLKLIIAVVITGAVLTGCFPDNNRAFDGPTVTEFKPILRSASVGSGNTNTVIQLVGPQVGSDTSIPITVDAASTAVAGTHYNAIPASITIPANSSSATLTITMIPGSVPAGSTRLLRINMGTSNSGVEPNPNFRTFNLTMTP